MYRKEPVLKEFLTLFPATVELSIFAMMFAVLLSVPMGVIAALRRGKALDHGLMGVALFGYSMPIFWWGLLLVRFFSVTLDLPSVSGRIDLLYYFAPVTGFMTIDALPGRRHGL